MKELKISEKKKKIISATLFIIALLIMGVITWFVGKRLVRYAAEPERFRDWVDSNGIKGRLLYMGVTVLQVVIAFIPGEPLEIMGGFAFGTLLFMFASTVGSSAIGTENYVFAIVVFGATLLISGVGLLIFNAISRKKENDSKR